MHTPPNEQSQRKQRNTPKNTAPFEARTSLGSRKKSIFLLFWCSISEKKYLSSGWISSKEKSRMAKGYCEVGALRKSDVVQEPCPRGLGRLVKGKRKCWGNNIWIFPPSSSAVQWKYLYIRRKFSSKFWRSSVFKCQHRFVYLLLSLS